jgi:hypothetical protein
MCVSVASTPGTLERLPAMTSAIWSNSRTRTIAIRSTSPATEYTSLTPSTSAIACATSGILSASTDTITIAVITRRGYNQTAPATPRRRRRSPSIMR